MADTQHATHPDSQVVRVIFMASDPLTETEDARPAHTLDLSVYTHTQLRDVATSVARHFTEHLEAQRINTDWLREPDSRLVIAPAVGEKWDQDATLEQLRVRNGDTLVLTTEKANERYPALVENLADSSAAVRNGAFSAWDRAYGSRFAAVVLPAVVAGATLSAAAAAVNHTGIVHWVLAGILVLTAVVLLASGMTFAKYQPDSPAAAAVSLAAHPAAAAAAASVIPAESVTLWALLAGAAAAWGTSITMLSIKAKPHGGHAAVFIGTTSVVAGLALSLIWSMFREVTPYGVATLVATIAFCLFIFEVPISKKMAGLTTPPLPGSGEEVQLDKARDIVALSREISSSERWMSMIHDEDRNIEARYTTLGNFIATGVIVAVCAFISVASVGDETLRYVFPEISARWVALLTYAILGGLLVLRGSWYRDRGLRGAATVAGLATFGAYLAGLGLMGNDPNTIRVVGVFAAGIIGSVIWGLRTWGESDRPMTGTTNKNLLRLENLLLVFVLTNAAAMLNLFFVIRSL